MSRLLTPVTEYTSDSGSTHTLTPSLPPPDLMEEARSVLETGNLHRFKYLVDDNRADFKFGHVYSDGFSLPIILVQSYKKLEATMGRNQEMPIDDYCQCVRWLCRKGANLNHQDNAGRTLLHWCILTQTPAVLLQTSLELGANPALQDEEGQSAVHLAIRMCCAENLDIIAKSEPYGRQALDVASRLSGATPLIYAVQIASYEFVHQLLEFGVQVNTQEDNKYRRTALHYALYVNRTDIFELLLRKGARPDIVDYKDKSVEARADEHPNGTFKKMVRVYARTQPPADTSKEFRPTTALMVACQANEFETAQSLLDAGADPAEVDDGGKNALHYCAESEETACAELLLAKRPEVATKKDADGYSPLHLATIAGNVKLIHLLLQSGAEVDAVDNERHSSVHWAVVCGQADSLKALLDHKAKVMQPDIFGAYPLHYAAQVCGTAQPDDPRPTRILEMLLARSSRVDCLDSEKRSPLMWAGSVGAKRACEMLLKKGAKPSLGDKAGLTMLHCAASRGHPAIVELMAKDTVDIDINIGDKNDCSPLFYAVTLNQEDCVRALVKFGANVDHQDKKGRTAAHCAAAKDLIDMLKLLNELGANLWLANSIGDLPIHEAVHMGHLETVKHLASDSKALLDTKNVNEQACVHIAAYKNQTQMCNAVLRYGADVNLATVSEQGNPVTALDLTTSSECKEFIRRYGGQYAYELGLADRPEERQTLRLTTAIGGGSGGGGVGGAGGTPNRRKSVVAGAAAAAGASGSPGVNAQPYADAIRKAEEMIARREHEEQLKAQGGGAGASADYEEAPEDEEQEVLPEREAEEGTTSRSQSRRPSRQLSRRDSGGGELLLQQAQQSQTQPQAPPLPVMKEASTLTEVSGSPAKKPPCSVRTTSTTDLKEPPAPQPPPPQQLPTDRDATNGEADKTSSSTAAMSTDSAGGGGGSGSQTERSKKSQSQSHQQPQQQAKVRLNKPHKVPFFWEKRGKNPVQAMRIRPHHQQQQPPPQPPPDKQIQRSVREYERVRAMSRHSHSSKRNRIYEGAVSDKIMLKMLLEEYRRYCMSEYSLDDDFDADDEFTAPPTSEPETAAELEAAVTDAEKEDKDKDKDDDKENDKDKSKQTEKDRQKGKDSDKDAKSVKSSGHDLAGSSASSIRQSTTRTGGDGGGSSGSPKSKKFKERERESEFRAMLRETRDLYQQVQRQADETLRLARRMNDVLVQDQHHGQHPGSSNQRSQHRPATSRGPPAGKRISPAMSVGSSYPNPSSLQRRPGPPPAHQQLQQQPTAQAAQSTQRPKTSRASGRSAKQRQEQIRKVYSSGVFLPPVSLMDGPPMPPPPAPATSPHHQSQQQPPPNSSRSGGPGSLHSARCSNSAYNQKRAFGGT